MKKYILLIFLVLLFHSCLEETDVKETLFTLLDAKETGIEFSNDLVYDRDFNIYSYRNFYNGGGVAIGDIDNDGLSDVYLTSNMGENQLYKNIGDLKFENISLTSGTEGSNTWSTGVSMADVNGDGWLDIYVCNSGDIRGEKRHNELFINQQNGSFIEMAAQYGINDNGYSTHSAFFDFDKDGDLDMYLLNNSYRAISSFNPKENVRNVRDEKGGDKLFRNDGDKFTDISVEAGIYASEIGFGLGVTVGDVNQDGWDDIYISNDFFEKDYLYINNQDGTFSEELEKYMKSISVASMGADMADLNNDGWPEIFVTEMLPSDERRIKTKTTFEDWDKYQSNIKNGYYHQFTRNMLHLNSKNENFNEIGRYSGVEASDWSWGALLADFNNDLYRDIFVANGINKDLTDQDFINYISTEEIMKKMTANNEVNFKELIDVIPSERIPNKMFVNNGELKFNDMSEHWGLNTPSHSNGAAYGDLDNDGDLELIVNNVNMPLFFYENKSTSNHVQFSYRGSGANPYLVGTKVYVFLGDKILYDQFMPTKGFQSSMQYRTHFGLGEINTIDSVKVIWPDQKVSLLQNVAPNKHHILDYDHIKKHDKVNSSIGKRELFTREEGILDYVHEENYFVDFDRDRLLFHMTSTEGPKSLVDDFNGDNLDDVFICGSKGFASKMFLQTSNGNFNEVNNFLFEEYKESEVRQAESMDVDNDGDSDIYVSCGGKEFSNQSSDIKDRIYINDGNGNFSIWNKRVLSNIFKHSSVSQAYDYDGDGDQDLMVAERLKSGQYGVPCDISILNNDNGDLRDVTKAIAPSLQQVGMITDVKWADINGDNLIDIVYCGEYTKIGVLLQKSDGTFEDNTQSYGLHNSNGWWKTIVVEDVDGDGDQDIIAGNLGMNSRFNASEEKPFCMHVNDFDRNGNVEQIVCNYVDDNSFPVALRHDIVKQLPSLKKKYLKYEDYALKEIDDLFEPNIMEATLTLKINTFETSLFINEGGVYRKGELPMEVQYTPIYAIKTLDFDQDGDLDLLLGGNLYETKPEIGRYDAGNLYVLENTGKGQYQLVEENEINVNVEGQIRDINTLNVGTGNYILVTRNNDKSVLLKLN